MPRQRKPKPPRRKKLLPKQKSSKFLPFTWSKKNTSAYRTTQEQRNRKAQQEKLFYLPKKG